MDKEYDVKNEKVFNEMLQYMKVKAKRYSCSCTHLRAVGRPSPTIWDHSALPATRLKWTHPA